MSRSKQATVLAAGCALLAAVGSGRLTGLRRSVGAAVRRRRNKLPKGVQEYPAPVVDHRHLPDSGDAAKPVPGTSGLAQ